MHKYACVQPNGVVCYTMQLQNDTDVPGAHPEGFEYVAAPFDTPDMELVNSYYDFDLKAFVRLPPKPSEHHDFNGVTKQWDFNPTRAAAVAVEQRNQLLYACDWTQLADAPVDKAAWSAYRQALRDLTEQPDFPQTIAWPVAPAA